MIENKRILFIASKNRDYIRIVQELEALERYGASCRIFCHNDKSYPFRMLKLIFQILFSSMKKYDVVYVSFLPQLILPLFAWRWKNKLVITDFFVSAYDTLVSDRKKIREFSVIAKLIWLLDKRTVSKSDFLIADTNSHAEFFSEEFSADKNRTLVWYLDADTSIYHGQKVMKAEELKEKFIVLYFGSILPLQGVDVVLDAVKLLNDNCHMEFIIIGPVNEKEKVMSENVRYFSWLSQHELADWIGQSDLCLAGHFSADIPKASRTIPGKAYIYEAMDKPMILGDNPANHELFCEDNMHFFVKMGDPRALAWLIEQKYELWQKNDQVL